MSVYDVTARGRRGVIKFGLELRKQTALYNPRQRRAKLLQVMKMREMLTSISYMNNFKKPSL